MTIRRAVGAMRCLLGVVLVVIVLDAVATIAGAAVWAPVSPRTATSSSTWQGVLEREVPSGRTCRRLVLAFRDGRLTGHYELHLPAAHPLHEAVRSGVSASDSTWFAQSVLGDIEVLEPRPLFGSETHRVGWLVSFRTPLIRPATPGICRAAAAAADRVTIRVDIVPSNVVLRRQAFDIRGAGFAPDEDLVLVKGSDDVRVLASPASGVKLRPNGDVELHRRLENAGDDALSFEVLERRRLPGSFDWATTGVLIVGPALYGLGLALPLLLLWWALKRSGGHLGNPGLHRAVAAIAIVPIASGIASSLLDMTTWLNLLRADLLSRHISPDATAARSGVGATGLIVAASVTFWALSMPSSTSGWPGSARQVKKLVTGLVLTVLSAAAVALALTASEVLQDMPLDRALLALGLIALTYAGFVLLVGAWSAGTTAIVVMVFATIVGAAYAMFDPWVWTDGQLTLGGLRVFAATGAVAISFLAGTTTLTMWRTATSSFGGQPGAPSAVTTRRGLSVVNLAAFVVFGGAALWSLAMAPPPYWLLDARGLVRLAEYLYDLGLYAALALLVLALAEPGRLQLMSHESARMVGAAYAAVAFWWTWQQFLFLPATLIAGAALVYFVILPAAQPSTAFLNQTHQWARRLSDERQVLERRQASLQPPTSGRRYVAYAQEQRSLDEELRRIRLDTSLAGATTVEAGGWEHGRAAGMIAGALGAPWVVVALLSTELPSDPLSLNETAAAYLGWMVLQWPLYGFFFGYFWPLLRGRSGIPKAIAMAAGIVIPELVTVALLSNSAQWTAYLAWALQVLLFAVLLGILAGDRYVLKRAGLGWPHIFDVHRKRYLLGWGATVALAEAGLLAALITGLLPAVLEQAGLPVRPAS